MADKDYLGDVYKITGTEKTRAFYDEWAQVYDTDVSKNGYATPTRIAQALARYLPDQSVPILDVGCGTGLCGRALQAQGFTAIDGTDLSQGMLDKARATGAYRSLWQGDANAPMKIAPGDYAALTASGVISVGAAPPEMFDALVPCVAPGALLAFSYNGHTLENAAYMDKLAQMTSGPFTLLFEENGPHLPEIDLTSTVYVLERQG